MSSAREVAEVAAMQEVSFVRATLDDGEEKEFDRHALSDIGHDGIRSVILEARQAWVKFEDGTAITLSVYEGTNR